MADKQNNTRVHYIHRLSVSVQQRIVGIFVLAAVLVIAGLILFQIQSSHILDDRIDYDAYLANAQGVSPETLVNISGIDVGQVKSIDITDENKVHVRFFVYDRFQRLIRTDSTGELSKLSVIGNALIIIHAGSHTQPMLPPGSTIEIEEPVTIDELIARMTPVVTNLNAIVEKIAGVIEVIDPQRLEKTVTNISELSDNLRQLSEQINQGKGVIGRLAYDTRLADDVSASLTNVKDITTQVKPASARLDPLVVDVRQLVHNVDSNMQQVQAILAETEGRIAEVSRVLQAAEGVMDKSGRIADDVKVATSVVSEEIKQLPDMISKMQNLLDATNRTIENAQQVWPLSTLIPPSSQQTRIEPQPLDD